jgi:glycerol-3-phosphate dehydrogenase
MFEDLMAALPLASLDDVRRQLRIGMGPCQGGFCTARATGIACADGFADPQRATDMLRTFLVHRWIGLWPILHGEQLRQLALDFWMLFGTLDLPHVPADTKEVV